VKAMAKDENCLLVVFFPKKKSFGFHFCLADESGREESAPRALQEEDQVAFS
jgi:hypothetical protein